MADVAGLSDRRPIVRGSPSVLVLLSFLIVSLKVESRSMPYVSSIEPPSGPEAGGYTVSIVGRNMGFLDIDCQVYFGDALGEKLTVVNACI